MRLYLTPGIDEMAALQAAHDAGFRNCSVSYSANIGYFLQTAVLTLDRELDLIAAVRMVDPAAGTSPHA